VGTNLLLQLPPGPVDGHGHPHLRHAEQARDFRITVALKETQREDLSRLRIQTRQRTPQAVAQFAPVQLATTGLGIRERRSLSRPPRPHHVQGGVDRGPAKVFLGILYWGSRPIAPYEAQKDGLEYVLGVRDVARNSVGSAED